MNKISIIGLGFIGLPLACILADINRKGKPKFEITGIDKKYKSKLNTKEKFLENFKRNLTDSKLISILNKAKKMKILICLVIIKILKIPKLWL